ncbi:hypothetical protein GWK47_007195 [Chionoecetes opilio]|uniref:Uncharacterized protein n=1 Tax=Chionoecetes opilio TaxID=41210 RepID=A0A8J5CRD6_CHIOP|nr:hypothetical protein GWK47_007195 [Chionoecetes opilio]
MPCTPGGATVVITHRLLERGLQGPPNSRPPQGQREALTTILGPAPQSPFFAQGKGVSGPNWIPQPRRGFPGERGGGKAAPQTSRPAAPRHHAKAPKPTAAQGAGEGAGPAHMRSPRGHNRELEARKGAKGGLVSLQPPTTTHWTPQQQPRADGALLQRVRLGYCTREELQEDFEGQVCDHCEMHTRRPLVHYLLSCPATAPLRPGPAPAAQPAGGGLLSGRKGRAALMVRHTPRDVMLGVLRATPPPR